MWSPWSYCECCYILFTDFKTLYFVVSTLQFLVFCCFFWEATCNYCFEKCHIKKFHSSPTTTSYTSLSHLSVETFSSEVLLCIMSTGPGFKILFLVLTKSTEYQKLSSAESWIKKLFDLNQMVVKYFVGLRSTFNIREVRLFLLNDKK